MALAPQSVSLVSLSPFIRPILLEPVKLLTARERPCAFVTFETTRVVVAIALPAGEKTCLEPRAANPHTHIPASPASNPSHSHSFRVHPPRNAQPTLLDTVTQSPIFDPSVGTRPTHAATEGGWEATASQCERTNRPTRSRSSRRRRPPDATHTSRNREQGQPASQPIPESRTPLSPFSSLVSLPRESSRDSPSDAFVPIHPQASEATVVVASAAGVLLPLETDRQTGEDRWRRGKRNDKSSIQPAHLVVVPHEQSRRLRHILSP